MSARIFIFLFYVFHHIYRGFFTYLTVQQHKKPLPGAVSDIYEPERYQQFLSYDTEMEKLEYLNAVVQLPFDLIILFSPYYSYLERLCCGNTYFILLLTIVVSQVLDLLVDLPFDYYETFQIEEKYGLNKQTRKDFFKDEAIDAGEDLVTSFAMFLFIAYVGEHMVRWTHGFQVSWATIFAICGILFLALLVLAVCIALFSVILFKKRYTFTPLPTGDLRSKIEAMLVGAKKISEIYVYDESKKSVSKNAFLLKFLWHREFGIADNFVNENSERELLAVLSHEIGHLKHKKKIPEHFHYLTTIILWSIIVFLIHSPGPALWLNEWVRNSFGLTVNNYIVLLAVYSYIIKPFMFLTTLHKHHISRLNEDEADLEAVKNGYGEELIATFKRVSTDELIDIYPHPVLEFIAYDHPGMYHRIVNIRNGIEAQSHETTPL